MRARDVMTRPPVTVSPFTLAKEAANLLVENGFTTLPVVDADGRLVGMVTEADILSGRISVDPRSRMHSDWPVRPTSAPASTVGAVMTKDVITRGPNADAAELARIMLERHLRAIPIVDGEFLVGIVTRRDLLRTIARDDNAIAKDVRHHLELCFRRGDWDATVQDGVVTLADEFDDNADRHIATVVAGAVPGVVDVRVIAPIR
ncbi:CBS domain-containing protein [Actinocrispum wychmicini]|uniref:CBS domain protein n=1 Tax=Actinocrispum wychmicini TaxID=1213861 RepID=A0A4R2JR60_9PSEU|nr:CBS domain-containing protein [Actinocrispum wychmicini]TCO61964.1 CBS domain protein [Actinocrispum wychmicini]